MPDINELSDALRAYNIRAQQAMEKKLTLLRARLDAASQNRVLRDPAASLDDRRIILDRNRDRLIGAEERILGAKREDFVRLTAALDAMSPLKVLSRGYSIATDMSGGSIKSIKDVHIDDALALRLADGQLDCRVEAVREGQE